jgi:hypothetical protein
MTRRRATTRRPPSSPGSGPWRSSPSTCGHDRGPGSSGARNIPPEQGPHWAFEYIDADTPDEVRKAVRQNIYYGATTIKLVSDSHRYFYSADEVRAAVEEARAAGMTVAVHAYHDESARNAILGARRRSSTASSSRMRCWR